MLTKLRLSSLIDYSMILVAHAVSANRITGPQHTGIKFVLIPTSFYHVNQAEKEMTECHDLTAYISQPGRMILVSSRRLFLVGSTELFIGKLGGVTEALNGL